MRFYSRLVDEAQKSQGRVTVVFGSKEPVSTTIRYLESNGLHDAVAVSAPGDVPVGGTPTLLVVGRTGSVLNGWLGRLSRRQEDTVFTLIHQTTYS